MAFDITSPFQVVETAEGWRYYLQSSVYYEPEPPYDIVDPPDLEGPTAGGSAGAQTFTDLTDTPGTIGVDRVIVGNQAGDALRFADEIQVQEDGDVFIQVPTGKSITISGGYALDLAATDFNSTLQLSEGGVNISADTGLQISLSTGGDGSFVDLLAETIYISGNVEVTTASFVVSGLPTSNPSVAGALWNDSGILKISAG